MNNSITLSAKNEETLGKVAELKINDKDGIQTVSARELYKGLEITDRFNRWFESLLKYGFVENEDFCCVKTSTQQNQYGGIKEIDDYAISIDMAKQICMLQRSEQGKRYRQYLANLEPQNCFESKNTMRDKTMSVKDVATVLNVTPEALKKHIRILFPEIIKNGIETRLNEKQVAAIKQRMLPTTEVVGNKTTQVNTEHTESIRNTSL